MAITPRRVVQLGEGGRTSIFPAARTVEWSHATQHTKRSNDTVVAEATAAELWSALPQTMQHLNARPLLAVRFDVAPTRRDSVGSNSILSIGIGYRLASGPVYSLFEILWLPLAEVLINV